MAFAPVFGRVFPATFDRRGAAAAAAPAWWEVAGKTCIAAYRPIGAASLETSYTNLANPGTYDMYAVSAPTLAALGWSYATGNELRSDCGYATPTSTIVIRCTGSGGHNIVFASATDDYSKLNIQVYGSLHTYIVVGQGGWVSNDWVVPDDDVIAVAGPNVYWNGTFLGASGSAASSSPTLRFGYAATSEQNGVIAALAIYSDTLTAGEVATLSAAMAALEP